jgi:hypothetical protein
MAMKMLSHNQKEKLKANWGAKADSMACRVEVRVYDPLSNWECYIYAMNPENEDEICCLIKGFSVEVIVWSLSELASRFNQEREMPLIDNEFRPRMVAELFKLIIKGDYERR